MVTNENLPKWLISDESIINTNGNQSIQIQTFGASKAIFSIGILVSIIPLFLICNIKILFYKIRFRKQNSLLSSADLLIGNDYKSDEFYAKKILRGNNTDFEEMNQFSINNYLNKDIKLFSYQKIILESCFDLIKISKIKENKIKAHALSKSIKNISYYVIYRAFFSYYKSISLQRIHLISMPLILMAASEKENLPCSVYLHGLSIAIHRQIFPSIDQLFLISKDEKKYFSAFMPEHKINLYKFNALTEYQNKAVLLLRQRLLFSGAHADLMSIDHIKALSSFLKDLGIDLYYKIHPKTDKNKVEELKRVLGINDAKLIQDRTPLSDSMKLIQPKFIFGWFSSGLAESLSLDIIPVMIDSEKTTKKIRTLSTFNYQNRCLKFQTDQGLLKICSENNDEYQKKLNQLKNYE